jgi:hypothetical protein
MDATQPSFHGGPCRRHCSTLMMGHHKGVRLRGPNGPSSKVLLRKGGLVATLLIPYVLMFMVATRRFAPKMGSPAQRYHGVVVCSSQQKGPCVRSALRARALHRILVTTTPKDPRPLLGSQGRRRAANRVFSYLLSRVVVPVVDPVGREVEYRRCSRGRAGVGLVGMIVS